jgi:hypothetical protein
LSRVKLEVFTAAFRKIRSQTIPVSNTAQVKWDLEDQEGNRVSEGIYYLRVEVNGLSGNKVVIKKVLVLR